MSIAIVAVTRFRCKRVVDASLPWDPPSGMRRNPWMFSCSPFDDSASNTLELSAVQLGMTTASSSTRIVKLANCDGIGRMLMLKILDISSWTPDSPNCGCY